MAKDLMQIINPRSFTSGGFSNRAHDSLKPLLHPLKVEELLIYKQKTYQTLLGYVNG